MKPEIKNQMMHCPAGDRMLRTEREGRLRPRAKSEDVLPRGNSANSAKPEIKTK
ncbi:MAG: hypothetical protein KGJ13_03555 [Patescibacteria group bacterium]|nr:hypothetical protein [Patescibacteria group bacterium]